MIAKQILCGVELHCDSWVGYLTIIMAFVIFVGSVYLLLAAIFGRRMGYLVLAVAFFGYMVIQSLIWVVGVGPEDTAHLGPRGREPAWTAIAQGVKVASPRYPVVERYPSSPWREPGKGEDQSVQSASTAIQEFMAEEANAQLIEGGLEDQADLTADEFTVTDVRFATEGKTSLAAGRAFFEGGGPQVIVFAYHDPGSVPIYSWGFLIASVIGFVIHIPFLDRAERKRKAVLTGGTPPKFYGPA